MWSATDVVLLPALTLLDHVCDFHARHVVWRLDVVRPRRGLLRRRLGAMKVARCERLCCVAQLLVFVALLAVARLIHGVACGMACGLDGSRAMRAVLLRCTILRVESSSPGATCFTRLHVVNRCSSCAPS